jgi:hypothetical protein
MPNRKSKTEGAAAVRVQPLVGHRARSLTPRTDALLALLRAQGSDEWNAEDVMAFLRHSRKIERAIMWALGENGDFAQRKEGQGAYWWRAELRKRSAAMPNDRTEP